eukprot:scaffold318185_cov39-Tisochrysis_lutea.AAC.2
MFNGQRGGGPFSIRSSMLLAYGSSDLCFASNAQAKLNDADAERPEGVRSFDETPDPECR